MIWKYFSRKWYLNCSLPNWLLISSFLVVLLPKLQIIFRTEHFRLLLHNAYIINIDQRAKSWKFGLICSVQIPGDVLKERQMLVCPTHTCVHHFKEKCLWDMTREGNDNNRGNIFWEISTSKNVIHHKVILFSSMVLPPPQSAHIQFSVFA